MEAFFDKNVDSSTYIFVIESNDTNWDEGKFSDFDSYDKSKWCWQFLKKQKEFRTYDPTGVKVVVVKYSYLHENGERTFLQIMFSKKRVINELFDKFYEAETPEIYWYVIPPKVRQLVKENLCRDEKDPLFIEFYWVTDDV